MTEWGGVDLVVNNAVDTGPGSMVPILDLTVEQMEAKLAANVVAQLVLIRAVLPGMLAQGGGTIMDVTSHTATADPPGPVGRGGWGLAYAASKAAFHRFAPLLAVELGDRGIRAYNIDPGYVDTERQLANAAALGLESATTGGAPVRARRGHGLVGRASRGCRERSDGTGAEVGPDPQPPSRLARPLRLIFRVDARPARGSGERSGRWLRQIGGSRGVVHWRSGDQASGFGEPGAGADHVAVLDECFAVGLGHRRQRAAHPPPEAFGRAARADGEPDPDGAYVPGHGGEVEVKADLGAHLDGAGPDDTGAPRGEIHDPDQRCRR